MDCSTVLRSVAASTIVFLWSSGAFAQAGGLTLQEQAGPISGTLQAGQVPLGVVYTYADLGDNELDATNFTGRVAGDYDAPYQALGAYGSWTF
jgi:hypothetical protein